VGARGARHRDGEGKALARHHADVISPRPIGEDPQEVLMRKWTVIVGYGEEDEGGT
jgi:hypothetical protein